MKPQTWLITGASKGFGLELALYLLQKGHRVVATSRKSDALNKLSERFGNQLLTLSMQISNEADVNEKIQHAITHFGKIDVLVNNAGYGLFGTMEELSMEEIQNMYEVNVFGVLRVSRAILPHFRSNQAGTILNIASVAGSYTGAALGLYSSTKAAVIQFSEALKMEVQEFGIQVCAVCPGGFRTDFLDTSSMTLASAPIAAYTTVRNNIERYSHLNHKQGGDPKKFPVFIESLLQLEQLPARIYVGSDAMRVMGRRLDEIKVSMEDHRALSESTDCDDL
jgi:short-subunit dehydrogenase